jgi:hypothetical protein
MLLFASCGFQYISDLAKFGGTNCQFYKVLSMFYSLKEPLGSSNCELDQPFKDLKCS